MRKKILALLLAMVMLPPMRLDGNRFASPASAVQSFPYKCRRMIAGTSLQAVTCLERAYRSTEGRRGGQD